MTTATAFINATDTIDAGVMDASYARARRIKPALKFRLRARARVVVRAWRRYGGENAPGVLELGAAEGRTLLEIARRMGKGNFTGVELDPSLIESAGELPESVRLLRGDVCSLPHQLKNDSFELVSLLAVLEHLAAPERALSEARRIMRPGGILVATCPNPAWDSVAGRLGLVRDEHHQQRFDVTALARLIRSSGFQVLEARRFMWAPVAFLPYLHVPVSPALAGVVDHIAARLPLLKHLCVNAYVVARKPLKGSTIP